MSDAESMQTLIAEAMVVERVCRQMCAYDGEDPDEPLPANPGFKSWEVYVADVTAVLRALRAVTE